jgi:hypothetical protein
VDVVQLADAGAWMAAAGYVVVSVLGGVLAASAGLRLGRAALPARASVPAEPSTAEPSTGQPSAGEPAAGERRS